MLKFPLSLFSLEKNIVEEISSKSRTILFQEGEDDKATAKDKKVQALDTVTARCVAAVDSLTKSLSLGLRRIREN